MENTLEAAEFTDNLPNLSYVYFCVSVVSTFSIHTPPSKYGGIMRKRFNPPKGPRVIQSHSQLLARNIGLPLLYPNYSSL